MARLEDLIEKIRDPRLRQDLLREVTLLKKDKHFGLVFERHIPELAYLQDYPVQRGELVHEKMKVQALHSFEYLMSEQEKQLYNP